MTRFLGDNLSAYVQYAVAFAAILILLLSLAYILRLITRRRMRATGGGRGRPPRLGVVEVFDVDRNRQLLLLRRDNVEHLVMIGGETDVLIESAIVRAPHARVAAPQMEPGAEDAPLPPREQSRLDLPKSEPPRVDPPRPAPTIPPSRPATVAPPPVRPVGATLPPPPQTTLPPQQRVNGSASPTPPAPPPAAPRAPLPTTTIPPRPPLTTASTFASRLEDAIKRPPPSAAPDPAASQPLQPKATIPPANTTIPPTAIAKTTPPKAPPPAAPPAKPPENFDLGQLEDEMAKLLGRTPPTKN